MTAKTLASQLNKSLGYTKRQIRTRTFSDVASMCCRLAQQSEVPYSVYTAAYGIEWARQTGRIGGTTEIALRDKWKGESATALIAAVAISCPTIADVPRWLNANLDVIL